MSTEEKSLHFIEQIIEDSLSGGFSQDKLRFRFPPEPNGYLHIGHAKSICLNFGIAKKYNGKTNLRFDDTNPTTEDVEYVDSIREDIKWLGFEWDKELYSSNCNFACLILSTSRMIDFSSAKLMLVVVRLNSSALVDGSCWGVCGRGESNKHCRG